MGKLLISLMLVTAISFSTVSVSLDIAQTSPVHLPQVSSSTVQVKPTETEFLHIVKNTVLLADNLLHDNLALLRNTLNKTSSDTAQAEPTRLSWFRHSKTAKVLHTARNTALLAGDLLHDNFVLLRDILSESLTKQAGEQCYSMTSRPWRSKHCYAVPTEASSGVRVLYVTKIAALLVRDLLRDDFTVLHDSLDKDTKHQEKRQCYVVMSRAWRNKYCYATTYTTSPPTTTSAT